MRARSTLFRTHALLAALAWGASALLAGCACDAYPLAATRCDDWCELRQRLRCEDDDPADCVARCEDGDHPWGDESPDPCGEPSLLFLACYRAAPDSAFVCRESVGTTVRGSTCARESQALSVCLGR